MWWPLLSMLTRCQHWRVWCIFLIFLCWCRVLKRWRMRVSTWTKYLVNAIPNISEKSMCTIIVSKAPMSWPSSIIPVAPLVFQKVWCCLIEHCGATSIMYWTSLHQMLRRAPISLASCPWHTCMAWWLSLCSDLLTATICSISHVCPLLHLSHKLLLRLNPRLLLLWHW